MKPLANHSFPLKMLVFVFFCHHFYHFSDTPYVYLQHVRGIYLEVRSPWISRLTWFSLFNISSHNKNLKHMLAIRVISCRVSRHYYRVPMIRLDPCWAAIFFSEFANFAGSECAQREEVRRFCILTCPFLDRTHGTGENILEDKCTIIWSICIIYCVSE